MAITKKDLDKISWILGIIFLVLETFPIIISGIAIIFFNRIVNFYKDNGSFSDPLQNNQANQANNSIFNGFSKANGQALDEAHKLWLILLIAGVILFSINWIIKLILEICHRKDMKKGKISDVGLLIRTIYYGLTGNLLILCFNIAIYLHSDKKTNYNAYNNDIYDNGSYQNVSGYNNGAYNNNGPHQNGEVYNKC